MPGEQEPSPRVLIVDDGVDELALLETLLQREGFTVTTANHGKRGVELAQQSPPDLLLLDLQMPGLDGFGVLTALKAENKTQDIPVIVVSGSSAERDIVRALNLGATDYVTKPYAIEILLARIRVALRSHLEKQAIWRLGEDLRNAQEELARARRSTAMGALAAALAHEINNPAAFVVADLHEVRELAHDLLEAGDEERGETLAALAEESLEGMNRIRDVVRDLSVFANVNEEKAPHSGVLDLAAIVKRRAERVGITATGVDRPMLGGASSGEDELDALVGLLIRHVGGGDNKVKIHLETNVAGRYTCLYVTPIGEVREASDALSLTIARELAERFGGTIESGADGGYVLKFVTSS